MNMNGKRDDGLKLFGKYGLENVEIKIELQQQQQKKNLCGICGRILFRSFDVPIAHIHGVFIIHVYIFLMSPETHTAHILSFLWLSFVRY